MPRHHYFSSLFALTCVALLIGCAHSAAPPAAPSIALDDNWKLQSSAMTTASGAEISKAGFDTSAWIPTEVPSTVLAALVRNGKVDDPFKDRNLETIPAAQFEVPWWYRTEFSLDSVPPDARLVFDGINYSAEIWLNGERIAGRDAIVGSFRVFELDVTSRLRPGTNVLAVGVSPPKPGDPTIGFVDWNPPAPDRYMGLWRGVTLRTTGGVSLDHLFVRGDVDPGNLDEGRVSVGGTLTNRTRRSVKAMVQGRIGPAPGIEFQREVALGPGEARDLVFGPEEFPQLLVKSPKLWWPVNMGDPSLYTLEVETIVGGQRSDLQQTHFGIRRIEDYINEQGHRGYKVNGRPVLLRGGGWVDDLLLVEDPQRLEDQIRYVRHMNLNTIRLEGVWGSSHKLYDLADRHGIMMWVGWSCQWEWADYIGQPVDEKFGGINTPEEMDLIVRSLNDQVVLLRNHPSVIVWNLGSDMLPNPELERRYLDLLKVADPTRPSLSACSVRTSDVTGPTAVKMNGPYEWVPPNYWYDKDAPGGAFGFNTETGPGAQPSVASSMRRMLPEKSWWPIDEMWAYHSARGEFKNLDRYVLAMNARYGEARDLDDFSLKAQMVNYEAMRGMFEAFSLRRPVATGVIQWMLNAAWPKVFWQLYDYYLMPNGAFYAVRNSGRPIHIAFDYGSREIVAVNDTTSGSASRARVRVIDAQSNVLFDETRPLNVAPGTREKVLVLPENLAKGLHFIDARIVSDDGREVARNFYWLPARMDVLDWGKGEWFYTPVKEFADLKEVNTLPRANVEVQHRFLDDPEGKAVEVTLRNSGPELAFFIELEVAGKSSGQPLAPIFWDDNYVSVLPGETRTVRATIPAHSLAGDEPVLRYQGINIQGNR